MADKTIGSLPQAPVLTDDSSFVCEDNGEAKRVTGKQIKDFAKKGVSDEAEAQIQAIQSAGDEQTQRVAEEGATQTANAKAQADAAAKSAAAAQSAQSGAEAAQSAAAQSAQDAADVAATLGALPDDVNQLKEDLATITPDDGSIDGKPWTSKQIVDSLCQPFSETGNPVQCYPVENYPLGVKIRIEPRQAGEGDPSPENVRPISGTDAVSFTLSGETLVDLSDVKIYANWRTNIAKYGSAPTNVTNRGFVLPVNPQKQYTIQFTFRDGFPQYLALAKSIDGVSVRYAYITSKSSIINSSVTFIPASGETWYLWLGMAETESVFLKHINKIDNIQLELGSGDTEHNPNTGVTYNFTLPETVYGGTLDVNTGVLTVDMESKVFDGSEDEQWTHIITGLRCGFRSLTLKTTTADYNILASTIQPNVGSENTVDSKDMMTCRSTGYPSSIFYIFTPPEKISTVEMLREWLSQHPLQICYRIEEPYTIQLTPQQVTALSGMNTIHTDADSVTVTGREHPSHTIEELKNAIISLGGNI